MKILRKATFKREGNVILEKGDIPRDIASKRDIILTKPKTTCEPYHFNHDLIPIHGKIHRGTPTPLIKFFGNPHIAIRPLRQAVYAYMKLDKKIGELIPDWKDGKIVWTNE